ncbi:MAG: hypothetical protein LUE87_09980 [Lachnospiraceae bacterium]|nr:hypothetical protein [Lachnospiraceae bacterium]
MEKFMEKLQSGALHSLTGAFLCAKKKLLLLYPKVVLPFSVAIYRFSFFHIIFERVIVHFVLPHS